MFVVWRSCTGLEILLRIELLRWGEFSDISAARMLCFTRRFVNALEIDMVPDFWFDVFSITLSRELASLTRGGGRCELEMPAALQARTEATVQSKPPSTQSWN